MWVTSLALPVLHAIQILLVKPKWSFLSANIMLTTWLSFLSSPGNLIKAIFLVRATNCRLSPANPVQAFGSLGVLSSHHPEQLHPANTHSPEFCMDGDVGSHPTLSGWAPSGQAQRCRCSSASATLPKKRQKKWNKTSVCFEIKVLGSSPFKWRYFCAMFSWWLFSNRGSSCLNYFALLW